MYFELLNLLYLAFLGGFILNIMPCVLPVISMKVYKLAKISKSGYFVGLSYALAVTLGLLISFWGMGAFMIFAKSAGTSLGWGFQFQSPVFVSVMATLCGMMGLAYLDFFQLGTKVAGKSAGLLNKLSRGRGPQLQGVLEGVFLAIIATPCTGPLLGPVLGATAVLPPLELLAVLTSLGLGIMTPILLIGTIPPLKALFPRSGWFTTVLKYVAGISLVFLAGWLYYVVLLQLGFLY